jgi:hypothetical protein
VLDVVDLDHVGVRELCQRLRLASEAAPRALVEHVRLEPLERHLASETNVAGAKHLAHATLAEQVEDLEAAAAEEPRAQPP